MAKVKITQIRSNIRRPRKQKLTLEALGLRGVNQTVEHTDTPQLRGMIARVHHLVRVEEDGQTED